MRGRTITYKYKNFKYDAATKSILDETKLTLEDENFIDKLYEHYKNLNVNRGYKYIIKDLYVLIIKKQMSTTDVSKVYNLSNRTIQIWLKELGLNRTMNEAQKIATKKKDYKSIKETYKKNTKIPNTIKEMLAPLLIKELQCYDIIIGTNALGIINFRQAIPVIIIKDSVIYKFIIIIKFKALMINKQMKDELINKGYTVFYLELQGTTFPKEYLTEKIENIQEKIINSIN